MYTKLSHLTMARLSILAVCSAPLHFFKLEFVRSAHSRRSIPKTVISVTCTVASGCSVLSPPASSIQSYIAITRHKAVVRDLLSLPYPAQCQPSSRTQHRQLHSLRPTQQRLPGTDCTDTDEYTISVRHSRQFLFLRSLEFFLSRDGNRVRKDP